MEFHDWFFLQGHEVQTELLETFAEAMRWADADKTGPNRNEHAGSIVHRAKELCGQNGLEIGTYS